jgi:hypothetical protein
LLVQKVPDHNVSICNDGGHQEISLGKFPHISRRASSISSSEIVTPKSADSTRKLRRGF